MKRISVSKSPNAAPSKCVRSSIKTHPPTGNAWPHTSSRAYQPVPSPKSLAWAGPYASGRTHSTPTSIPAEPATHPTEAINGHYRAGQTHRQRLPQPHQLQTPNAPHRRRPRRLHPHSTMKSRYCGPDARGGSSHGPLDWTWSQEGLAPCMRTGWPSAEKTSAPVSRSRRWIPSRDSKNAIA